MTNNREWGYSKKNEKWVLEFVDNYSKMMGDMALEKLYRDISNERKKRAKQTVTTLEGMLEKASNEMVSTFRYNSNFPGESTIALECIESVYNRFGNYAIVEFKGEFWSIEFRDVDKYLDNVPMERGTVYVKRTYVPKL